MDEKYQERYVFNRETATKTCRGCGTIHNPLHSPDWVGQHNDPNCWVLLAEQKERRKQERDLMWKRIHAGVAVID